MGTQCVCGCQWRTEHWIPCNWSYMPPCVSCLVWVPENELRSSAREMRVLNALTTLPVSEVLVFLNNF